MRPGGQTERRPRMPARDLVERALISRIAAHSKRLTTADRAVATAAARRARDDQFLRQVDPDGVLDPAEHARRAEHAKKAHFTRLALKSAQARRARSLANRIEEEIARELVAPIGSDSGDVPR